MTWANRIKVLKQQFQALGATVGTGLINAFKPFVKTINAALKATMSFAENVLNALGKIFGWEYEITGGGTTMEDSLIDAMEEQADALNDIGNAADDTATKTNAATKANEEYKNSVLGFDELNKLNDVSSGSGSSSGSPSSGSGSGKTSGSGTTGALISSSDVTTSFRRIPSLYESEIDNLFDLGSYIGNALAKSLNNIDWESKYAKAKDFGTGLAKFLNGLITPDTFGSIGGAIAGAINTAVLRLSSFFTELDWKNLGSSLASLVNTGISRIDFTEIGTGIATLVKGIFDAAKTFIDEIDWDELFESIKSTFDEIPGFGDAWRGFVDGFETTVSGLASIVSGIGSAFGLLFDALGKMDPDILEKIGKALGMVLGAIVTYKITTSIINGIKNVVSPLTSLHGAVGIWGAAAGVVALFVGHMMSIQDALAGFQSANSKKISDLVESANEITADVVSESSIIELEHNYTYLSEVLDKYLELNEKLNSGGELTVGERAMLEEYYDILEKNVPKIVDKIGTIGTAYTGTREELQALLNEEYTHAQAQYYIEKIEQLGKLQAELEYQQDKSEREIKDKMKEALRESIKAYREDSQYSWQKYIPGWTAIFGEVPDPDNISDEQLDKYIDAIMNGEWADQNGLNEHYALVMTLKDEYGNLYNAYTLWGDYKESMAAADEKQKEINADIEYCNAKLVELSDESNSTGTVVATNAQGMKVSNTTVKNAFTDLKKKAGEAWESIKSNTKGFGSSFKTAISDMKAGFTDAGTKLKPAFGVLTDLWDTLTTRSVKVVRNYYEQAPELKTATETLVAASTDTMTKKLDIVGGVSKLFERFGISIPKGLAAGEKSETGVSTLTNASRSLPGKIWNALGNLGEKFKPKGEAVDTGIARGMLGNVTTLTENAGKLSGKIFNALGNFNSIFQPKGEAVDTGIIRGMNTRTADLKAAAGLVPTRIYNALGSFNAIFQPKGEAVDTGIIHGISAKTPELKASAAALPTKMLTSIGDIVAKFKPEGTKVDTGLQEGINGGISNITNATKIIPGKMIESLGNLNLTLRPAGKSAADGLTNGVNSGQPELWNAMAVVKNIITGVSLTQENRNHLWQTGRDAIDSLRNGWTSTSIPVPHFTVSTKNSTELNTKVPTVAVAWYASGGLVTDPSLIGVGEAGHEAVLPLSNRGAMSEIAASIVAGMVDSGALANAVTRGMVAAGQNTQPVIVNATLRTENDEVLARAVTRGQQKLNYRLNPVGA